MFKRGLCAIARRVDQDTGAVTRAIVFRVIRPLAAVGIARGFGPYALGEGVREDGSGVGGQRTRRVCLRLAGPMFAAVC